MVFSFKQVSIVKQDIFRSTHLLVTGERPWWTQYQAQLAWNVYQHEA